MGDVVDTFRTAMTGGFHSARWVAQSALPPFEKQAPAAVPTGPDISGDPEVVAAKKVLDDAKTKMSTIVKDTTASVDSIKQASDALKAAEDSYKNAKKAARARAKGETPPPAK